MKIGPDTWVFQDLITRKRLSSKEITFLEKLIESDQHQIVLSINFLCEIVAREDKSQVLKIAGLLDKCPNLLWMKSPEHLLILELKQSYNKFKNWPLLPLNPYTSSPAHILHPDANSLLIRINNANLTISEWISMLWDPSQQKRSTDNYRDIFHRWASNIHKIANSFRNKQKWEKEVKNTLTEKLRAIIVQNELIDYEDLKNDAFLDFLVNQPELIMSFYFPFHLQHFLHRNSSKFETSNIGDLSLCSAINYVDQMILDSKMYKAANQAIVSMSVFQEIGPYIKIKLNNSIDELKEKLG